MVLDDDSDDMRRRGDEGSCQLVLLDGQFPLVRHIVENRERERGKLLLPLQSKESLIAVEAPNFQSCVCVL
jgi:hypothetical protein